jgi:hypothetical protein
MADVTEGSFVGRTAERAGALVQYAGAAVSIALVAGVGIWGYKLFVRDVTGVPIVRAMEGPMRMAPADPGGEIALNTGLSVNAVVARGEAAPPEDVLLLAPASNGLAAEDMEVQSMAEAGEVAPEGPAIDRLGTEVVTPVVLETDAQAADLVAEATPEYNLQALPDTPMTPDQVLALADQIAAGATPLTALSEGTEVPVAMTVDGQTVADAPEPATDLVAAAEPALTLISASVPGVSVAYRPPTRPGHLAVSARPEAGAVVDSALVTTTPIPVGTALVQLGAYDTADIAASAWDRLSVRFAEFMNGKERVIQSASSNGATFFRLRAMGFADLEDARRFCAVLDAEDTDCVPVVVD